MVQSCSLILLLLTYEVFKALLVLESFLGLDYVKMEIIIVSSDMTIVRKTFKNMWGRFMKIRKEYKPSGSAGGVPIEPTWPYYKQMLYLAPFMKHRTTKGTFTVIEQATLSAESSEPPVVEDDNEVFKTNTMSHSEEELVDEAVFVPEASSSHECMPQQNIKRAESYVEVSSPSPSTSKSKKAKRNKDQSELLLEVVQNTNQCISKAGLSSQLDEDDLFGQSVGKDLKTLSPYQKSLAKMKIQQILHEIRWSVVEK